MGEPTYAFHFSDNHGETWRRVATGVSEAGMTEHRQRVLNANQGPHLRVTTPDDGHQLQSRGGSNDGWVWSWRIER